MASVLAWITQVIPSVYGSWNTARGSSSSVSKGTEWPNEGFAKGVTCNSNSDSVCMDLCLSSLSVHGSASSHSATIKQHPCLRLNWNARKKAECRQEPFRKWLLCWAQVSNKSLPVPYQNLKTVLRLTASSLWLPKAQRSGSAFVSYDWGQHDFFPSPSSLWFWFFFLPSYTLTGEPHPRVHPGSHEDAVLPVLPRLAYCETLQQLLSQRHEGLSSQPGRSGHWVESLHR